MNDAKMPDETEAALIEALERYEAGGKREGCAKALVAVLSLLEAPSLRPLRKPLFALLMALDDVENGRRNALFEVDQVQGHRPQQRHDERAIKGMAAAAMELFMKAGLEREQAARKVCRVITRSWDSPIAKNSTWQKVAGWRDRIKERLAEDAVDVKVFLEYVEHAENGDAVLAITPW